MVTAPDITPKELMLHESIKRILADMQDLRSLVAKLQAENLALKEEFAASSYHQSLSLDANGKADTSEMKLNRELADLIATDAERQRQTARAHDMELDQLNDRVESLEQTKMATVSGLQKQVQATSDHDKQLDTIRVRVRTLEHANADIVKRKDIVFFEAETDRTKAGMAEFRVDCDDIKGQMEALRVSVEQVSDVSDKQPTQNNGTNYHIQEHFNEREKKDSATGMTLRDAIKSRQKQEHVVDDCNDRETLLNYYSEVSKAAYPGKEPCSAGIFKGSLNDMWALQSRIEQRLATLPALRDMRQKLEALERSARK